MGLTQIKNWLPLVFGPELAMLNTCRRRWVMGGKAALRVSCCQGLRVILTQDQHQNRYEEKFRTV